MCCKANLYAEIEYDDDRGEGDSLPPCPRTPLVSASAAAAAAVAVQVRPSSPREEPVQEERGGGADGAAVAAEDARPAVHQGGQHRAGGHPGRVDECGPAGAVKDLQGEEADQVGQEAEGEVPQVRRNQTRQLKKKPMDKAE